MLKKAFSFSGRIRRLEYGVSSLITFILLSIIIINMAQNTKIYNNGGESIAPVFFFLLQLPVYWFWFAQGAKREHDLGFSGWWQLYPARPIWLLFLKGEESENEYGLNPKAKIIIKNINISESSIKNAELIDPFSKAIEEIEKKEKLLLKSFAKNLLTDDEFIEKNNNLKRDKTKLINDQKETDIKSLASSNISDKIHVLEELLKQKQLTESEFLKKSEALLTKEIEFVKQKLTSTI